MSGSRRPSARFWRGTLGANSAASPWRMGGPRRPAFGADNSRFGAYHMLKLASRRWAPVKHHKRAALSTRPCYGGRKQLEAVSQAGRVSTSEAGRLEKSAKQNPRLSRHWMSPFGP
jgi:hypothetical protein